MSASNGSAKDLSESRFPGTEATDDNRLRPEMASFRVLVLRFVRDYITRHQLSPSQGEIVNALDSNRTRVRHALRSLAEDGLILRTPGERGLKLPDEREAALRTLRALGYRIPDAPGPVSTLPDGPELDYP